MKGDLNIGIRSATLPPITQETVVAFSFNQFLLIVHMNMFMKNIRVVSVLMVIMGGEIKLVMVATKGGI